MMNADIRIEPSEKHGIEVHVPAVASWDGLDTIANFFRDHFGATILERLDGPDSRVFELEIQGEGIVLVHDDLLGNRFYPQHDSGAAIVRELAEGLTAALANGGA